MLICFRVCVYFFCYFCFCIFSLSLCVLIFISPYRLMGSLLMLSYTQRKCARKNEKPGHEAIGKRKVINRIRKWCDELLLLSNSLYWFRPIKCPRLILFNILVLSQNARRKENCLPKSPEKSIIFYHRCRLSLSLLPL